MAAQRPALAAAGANGPVMVSIGDPTKLRAFLEANPKIPRDLVFVDDSESFEAYEAAGFGKIGDAQPTLDMIKAPEGLDGWKYLTTVPKVSPTPKRFGEFPEGVVRLGGTFVLKGDDIAFGWSDVVPGDHPKIADVLAAAGATPV
mmetsp:Transcript_6976/g.23865  ORF Transcript_6976/g.23865 Transcript_6976/m.23865 type:complete len:145 (-) Transcript_6976:322-756(-)